VYFLEVTGHPRRTDIQGLRAVAIIMVVLDHAHIVPFWGGFEGVDVFFVLSGFVITQSLLDYQPAPLHQQLTTFYSRRIRRIIPAASVALVVTLLVAYVQLRTTFPQNLIGDVRWANFFGENVRLTATSASYLIPGLVPSLVTPFWSLAVEEQFYVLYPLMFFALASRVPAHHFRRFLTMSLTIVVVASAIWSWHDSVRSPIGAYYALSTRAWELGLGALVALIPHRWHFITRRRAEWVGWAAVAALGLGVITFGDTTNYPGVRAWVPCAATATLLFIGTHPRPTRVTQILSLRPMQFVGAVSYSWYLYHFLWLTIPLYVGLGGLSRKQNLLALVLGFACAVVSYYVIENPVRRSALLKADSWLTGLLLVICLASVIDATLVINTLLPH
jgi:peptidoglycan/LPS O-acetylase OafA/YrhL